VCRYCTLCDEKQLSLIGSRHGRKITHQKTFKFTVLVVRSGSEAEVASRDSDVRYAPERWGNRPASLWIAEDFRSLQADGETRSVFTCPLPGVHSTGEAPLGPFRAFVGVCGCYFSVEHEAERRPSDVSSVVFLIAVNACRLLFC
jgi:hypothetical protein